MDKQAFQVIATTLDGRDITRGFVDNLPLLQPADSILRRRYASIYNNDAYRDLLTDDQVYSTVTQRRLALIARDFEVVAGGKTGRDKMAADYIREILQHIRWDTVCEHMWYANFFGYAVSECLWAREGSRVMLDKIKVRNHARFGFDPQFKLKLLTTQSPQGEELPENKFWWAATGETHDDEPYGLGLAHYLYWPVRFKRGGMKYWLKFLDKFGAPSLVAKYPEGSTDEQQRALLNTVNQLRNDSAMILPENMMIDLVEANRSGKPEYNSLYDKMNDAISKVVVGQTMTTDDGSSRSQAEVHLAVRDEKVMADAHLLDDSFSRSVVRWLIEWNYPGAAMPKVRRVFECSAGKAQAERDKILFDIGYRPTKEHIEETYKIMVDDVGLSASQPQEKQTSDFAEGSDVEEALEAMLSGLSNQEQQKLTENITQPLLDAIDENPDYILGLIAERYPGMDGEALQDLLARIIFVAESWGRLNARGG